ncbi:MAG: YraN family protein [Gemmatimonadales bacterium]|nr:MAG: YraN family protein [Gemmatimonadales bacterium]
MESNVGRGRRGESIAAAWLEARGWTVLDRNWRDGPRELDLVAHRDGTLAFLEVKTRSSDAFGAPLESIGPRKRRDVERAARAWIRSRTPEIDGVRALRFDAVSVRLNPSGAHEILHVEGAWRTGE